MLITTINFALYVCLCRGVTDRAITAEIARGACTVEEIAACTGAGTGCGRCRVEVEELILTAVEVTVARRVALKVLPGDAEADAAEAEAANETRAA